MNDDTSRGNLGLFVVYITLTCVGLLGLLAFVHTDFGLPEAAITRHLFPKHFFAHLFAHFFAGGFEIDISGLTSRFIAGFNLLAWAFAFVFPLVVWLVVAVRFVRRLNRWTYRSPSPPGPADSPPSPHDPALVATLWGKGSPAPEAIAGTVLSLASLNRIEIPAPLRSLVRAEGPAANASGG